jgi:uncharacterized membrane protein
MATYNFTAAYKFQYRFTCEHCGQTTGWLPAMITQQEQYTSQPFEGKGIRLAAEENFKKEFARKVPDLREKIEAGDYTIPVGLSSKCPTCKKRQSWEKVTELGWLVVVLIICVALAFVGMGMFNSGAESGNGHRQLAGLIIGILFAVAALGGVIALISGVVKKAAIRRDMEKTTVRNKPEFNWPEIEPTTSN